MASGLASTPSSCTLLPAGPSSCLASSMLCVVSGHIVVHSESSKASMTTLPRNWLSDIGWPNWLTSLKSGAGLSPSEVPRSRLGFSSAAAFAEFAWEGAEPCDAGACDPDDEQPATASAAATAAPASHDARRVLLLPR